MKHRFPILLATAAFAWSAPFSLPAAEVSLEQAETAVANWIRLGRDPAGRREAVVETSRTVVDEETGAAVHVVRLAGGGFVVTASDDTRSPIMASSDSGDLDTDARNPMWALLRRDAAWGLSAVAGPVRRNRSAAEAEAMAEEGAAANRAAWAELLGEGTRSGGSPVARKAQKGISDWASDIGVTVPLTETEWSQTTHNGMDMESGGLLCYNYYTPSLSETPAAGGKESTPGSTAVPVDGPADLKGNWPCGCTATAAAQLMYHYQLPVSFQHAAKFPKKSVPAKFRWSKMKKRPLSESAREAVGKLTGTIAYKIGTSFTRDGSGQPVGSGSMGDLPAMLTGTAPDGTDGFGWKNADYLYTSEGTMELETMQKALIPNLDGGFPCLMGIGRSGGRHAIVIDGYRFSENTFSVHANFGWGGASSAWYVPPTFATPQGTYTVCDELLYNAFPGDSGSLISVHVVDETKRPLRGWKLTSSPSSNLKARSSKKCAAGTCVFFAPAGTYTFTATCGGGTKTGTVTVGGGSGVKNRIVPLVFRVSRAGKVKVGTMRKKGAGAKDGTATAYTDPLTVTLSSETEGAEIYYTLDGSEPNWEEREDEEGNVKALNPACRKYTGPFELAGADATIRAVAAKDGMVDSEETEASFTFRETKSRDKFADARVIAGICGTAAFDTTGCGSEQGEPVHSAYGNPASASVWAAWTAPQDGDFTFRLSGVSADDWILDTQLAVYTGTSVSKLTRVAVNDDAGAQDGDYSSCVTFQAQAGTTYRIAMDSYDGANNPGTLTLKWSGGRTDFVSIHARNQAVSGGGERKSFSLETSSGWVLEEYSSWLRPLAESGSDSLEFSYEATANPTGKVRSGHLLFRSGEDGWGMVEVTQSTVPWVTNKADAVAAAKASGKRILLLSGRDSCGNTRYTRFTSCEDDLVRDLIRDGYVAWYNDCDNQGEETWEYLGGLGTYALPLVCVLESDARAAYRSRTTGLRTAEQLRAVLDDAVLFDAAGGTVKELVRYRTPGAAYGELPEPTMAGNSFVGWFETETGGSAVTAAMLVPSGATTLHARWEGCSYRVTFDQRGGSGGTTNAAVVFGEDMPAIAVPTRDRCEFLGYWSATGGAGVQYYTADGKSARAWDVAANATLHAKWTIAPAAERTSFHDPDSAFWDVEFGEPGAALGHGAYAAAGGGTEIGCTTNVATGAKTWWVPGSEDPGILQRAVDQARAGDTIQVAPGCYGPITVGKDRISIVSTGGRMKTFINGQYSARCVDFGSTKNGKITGFTLVQGNAGEGDGGGIRGGSASYCLIEGCQAAHGGGAALSALSDCFVTWNTAGASGGGAYGGSLLRCEVRHNEAAIGGGAVATTATGTLLAGNEATTKAGGAEQSTLMACTVADNRAKSAAGVSGCTVKNSLLHGNRLRSGATNNYVSSTCQYTCAAPVPAGTGNFNADPNFVKGDENYHLNNYSKCRDKANKNLSKTPYDLAGLDRAMGSNADAGACEYATGVTPLDAADYDGDGLPDVGFFNPVNGTWFVKRTSDGTVWRLALGDSGSKLVPRDYDGDGVRDPAVYDSNTGTWKIRLSGTGSVVTKKLGWKGITAVDAADFDGDGKADPIIFNPASTTWQILQSGNGATAVVKNFGTSGVKLFCGDYDGDGYGDLAYYVAKNYRWYVRFHDGRTTWVTLGASGVRPCPVDLDMDGALDAGYFDPATGKWTVRSFATRATTTVKFGDKTTTPHPYDWNNDGVPDTLGVYSPYRAGFLDLYKNADGSTTAHTINF